MRQLLFICSFVFSSQALLSQNIVESLNRINSPYDEQSPVWSPDGKSVYFTIANHPANVGGKQDPGDIWFTQVQGSTWSAPVHAGPLLNDRGYNAVAGISQDGSQLFLLSHYGNGPSPAKTQGIAVSKWTGSDWSRPENLVIPYFMNKSGILCGSLSADNSVFIFSAESYGTYGVEDIYVSINEGGKWSEPRNLGQGINTQFQELSPSLSADNKTLYFASNGRKGYGSFDIYSATRVDESWTNWTVPQNLGPDVNSDGRELFYRVINPGMPFAFLTTTRSSEGYGDVLVHAMPDSGPMADASSVVAAKASAPDLISSPLLEQKVAPEASTDVTPPTKTSDAVEDEVTVHGKITNARTGEVIPARISFEGPAHDSQSVTSDENGYSIAVASSQYSIRIEAGGYVSTLEKLDLNAVDTRNLEMNFRLQPVEVGTTVNLKNVLFAQAKTDILPESYPELDLVVAFLKENPKVRIELMGHTDGRGVHADNVRLSQQRVDKVKDYLVSRGIESRRISGKGFGGSKPIASNDTEESRRMNRRVEFVIRKF